MSGCVVPVALKCLQKTALIDASKRGRVHEVMTLVENDKASLTCNDEQGLTPLHHACRHGRKEVVVYLVSRSEWCTICGSHDVIM